jgi:DNA modification methylase
MELNKIYKGDARELLKGLGDKSIDVCLTDFMG